MSKNHVDVTGLSLIKCDVEGHEAQVVAGMRSTLARASFPLIWIEVRGPRGSTRAPDTHSKVNELLAGLGYAPYQWSNGELHAVDDGAIVGREDVVFRHEASIRSM